MPKTKISEFSSTPANNTDIDSINIAEGCAPSGINDAIRELMAQLKDFQTGAVGDSFNGPVGTSTAAAGAFTTLSASSTLSVTGAGSIQGLTVGRGAGAVATNTAVGASALAANTTGGANVALGLEALLSNTTGSSNTAVGRAALRTSTTVSANTAVGLDAGRDTTGADNAILGWSAMRFNSSGANNTAIGSAALFSNTTASNNTAVGYQAGYSNTTGLLDAFGAFALLSNTTGQFNKAFGESALRSNTTGAANCAFGGSALRENTTGGYNSGFGESALRAVTTGGYNTAVGSNSGDLITTGTKNSILGRYSGNQGGLDIRTSSNFIVLSDGDGNPRLILNASGDLKCLGVYNNAAAASNAVNVDASGNVYRSTSALKYKTNVRDLEDIDINLFRPVRYNSKCAIDNPEQDHFGVIADEVDAAGITELVNYGADGEVEGFQYERLTVVLLKKLQVQDALITQLKARLDAANL